MTPKLQSLLDDLHHWAEQRELRAKVLMEARMKFEVAGQDLSTVSSKFFRASEALQVYAADLEAQVAASQIKAPVAVTQDESGRMSIRETP